MSPTHRSKNKWLTMTGSKSSDLGLEVCLDFVKVNLGLGLVTVCHVLIFQSSRLHDQDDFGQSYLRPPQGVLLG